MGIRIAVLGAGGMGRKHTLRLKELGAQVVAVCDKSPEGIRAYKETVGDAEIHEYVEFDKMLQEENFEALYICLPPFAHEGQFEKAAEAKKHIFIEKPIALNTRTGKRMAEAADRAGIITCVGFHMRQSEPVKQLKKMIENNEAGNIVLFQGQYSCNSLHSPWWRRVELCGGQIFEQAIHLYDMSRYLLGEPEYVAGIMANICHKHIPDYTVEDVSASFACMKNGAVSSITANNCEVPGKWIGKFKVVCENVTAEFSDFDRAVFTYNKNGETVTKEIDDTGIDALLLEDKMFLESIAAGHDTKCNITEGYKSLCYVENVVKSAENKGGKIIC